MNDKTTNSTIFEDYPDILTVHQVCEVLGIGRKGVYKLLECNDIRYFRIGNAYKIPKSSLIEFIRQSCNHNEGDVEL